jgi:hypothetical protein
MHQRHPYATFRNVVLLLLVIVLVYEQVSKREAQFLKSFSTPFDSIYKATTTTASNDHKSSSPASSPRYEMVVTLLHSSTESWKNGQSEKGSFLLTPEVESIPVTICSPDDLISSKVYNTGLDTPYFRPEADEVWGKTFLKSNRSGSVTILPIINGKRGQEVPGYVTYILHNYDALPDVVIFLHASPIGHAKNILHSIRHVIDHWTPEQIGFLHLNYDVVCRNSGGDTAWGRFYELLGFNRSHVPPYVKLPCCAQFMVTRERILLRPKWFYQQLLKLTYTLKESAFQEHYWHIFFGESAILPDDREVKHYIMSNWTRPVANAVLHNPYPNLPYSESMKPWYEKSILDPVSYYPNISSNRDDFCPPGSLYRY